MTKEELIERLADIEWDDFEVKEALNKIPENVWDSVSSFSNTSGGWIVFGVKQNGKRFEIQGCNNGEKTETDFLNTLRGGQKFNCKIFPECKKYVVDGKLVLAFHILSSPLKPVYYNNPINTFIRSGSADRRANEVEIAAMMRDQAFGTKSDTTVAGTSFDDLNIASIEAYRNRIRRENPACPYNSDAPTQQFCTEIGILKDGCLTYGSLLLFGKRTSVIRHCSNFWIDYLEIPGTSLADANVRYTFRMPDQENLWEYYQVLISRLRLHVNAPFTAGQDGYSPDDESELYALREGLVNLEAHSDYFSPMHPTIRVFDDRIEFQNPGRIMFPLDELRNKIHSVPRNPSIIRLLRHCRLGENAGYGIQRMLKWEDITGQQVIWESDMISTTVIYRRRLASATIKTTPKDEKTTPITTLKTAPKEKNSSKILRIIRSTPDISYDKLAEICNLTREGVKYNIKKLREEGFIEWEGKPRNGRWIVKK